MSLDTSYVFLLPRLVLSRRPKVTVLSDASIVVYLSLARNVAGPVSAIAISWEIGSTLSATSRFES